MYFKITDIDAEKVLIGYRGQELEKTQSGDYYYVELVGIPASKLDDEFVIDVIYDTNKHTVTYTPMAYCANVVNRETIDNDNHLVIIDKDGKKTVIDDSQEYAENVNENGQTVISNDKNESVSVSDNETITFIDTNGNSVIKDVDGNVIEDVPEGITESVAEATANNTSDKNYPVLVFAVTGAAALLLISVVAVILVKRKKRG